MRASPKRFDVKGKKAKQGEAKRFNGQVKRTKGANHQQPQVMRGGIRF